MVFTPLTLLPELPRTDELRRLYRNFDTIYNRHVEDAKFDLVKGHGFKLLKRRLAFICHLLREHPDITPKKRTELIGTLLSEDDLRHAQRVLNKSEGGIAPVKPSWSSLPRTADKEFLRKEMKRVANDISDSKFLLELKGVEDEDLKNIIQEVVALTKLQLSLSVDTTVNKLTRAVLKMQQDECNKVIQREIETEQRKVLGGMLMNFIRDINGNSAGRWPS